MLEPYVASPLTAALIQDRELESGIRGKQFGNFSETLGQRGRSEQRVIALAEIVIIDIKVKRQQVNRNCVGERRFEIFRLVAFRVGAVSGGEFAGLPGIERSLAAHSGFDLAPGQLAELARDSGALHQRVADVDIELEGDRKLVVHQARGNEDALRV